MPDRTRVRPLTVFLFVPLAALPSLLGTPVRGAESPVSPVRWQALPESIVDVCVGPDGRAWYELGSGGLEKYDDVPLLQKRIEAEFATPAPRIAAARVVLFEPGRRVWFRGWGRAQRTLLGYDGKAWVQREARADHFFRGEAPGRGRGNESTVNLFADGCVFFPDYDGVECFDGKQWAYQSLRTGPRPKANVRGPLLALEPDGAGVVALVPGDDPVLWRWRKGKWAQATAPQSLGRFQRFAPAKDGIWVFGMEHTLQFHPYNPNDPRLLGNTIAALDHADARVRDRAARTLRSMGPAILPALERALADEQRPEVIGSLQRVMAELREPRGDAARRRPGDGRASLFGPWRLGRVHALECLPDRTVLVAAEQITPGIDPDETGDGAPPAGGGADAPVVKAGFVLLSPDGAYRMVPVEEVSTVRGWGWADGAGPVVAGGGVWVSPRDPDNVPARLVSLADGTVRHVVPDNRFRWLRAATDAALFVATSQPSPQGGPIVVFQPGAQDDRKVLGPGKEYPVSGQGVGVATDGSVWAHRETEGLVRFDGKAWEPLGLLRGPRSLAWFLPANDGRMLLRADRGGYVLAGGGAAPLAGDDLKKLVAASPEPFVSAFDGAGPGNGWATYTALSTDKAKNLWLLEDQRLAVFANGRWIDPGTALRAAGSRVATVRFASPVGDGAKVFVTDFEQFAALGDVRGDQVVFSAVPAPALDDRVSTYRSVRDTAGGLWLSVWFFRPPGQDHPMGGQFTVRMTGKGVDVSLPNRSGRPVLADKDGNVWLADGGFGGFGRARAFRLLRDGKVVAELPVSGAGDITAMVADAPGSVYAWTDMGILHYRRPAGAGPAAFVRGETYCVEGITRHVRRVEFTPLGYAVVTVEPGLGERNFAVYLVPLPKQ